MYLINARHISYSDERELVLYDRCPGWQRASPVKYPNAQIPDLRVAVAGRCRSSFVRIAFYRR